MTKDEKIKYRKIDTFPIDPKFDVLLEKFLLEVYFF